MRPAISRSSGDSNWSCPLRTRFSSCSDGIDASDQREDLSGEHLAQKGIATLATLSELCGSEERWVDLATQHGLDRQKIREHLLEREVVCDDEQVDVAVCAIFARRDG